MNKDHIEYATIVSDIAALEARRELLAQTILVDLGIQGKKSLSLRFGRFSIVNKPKWSYSPALVKEEQNLKIKKMREQDKGVAKNTPNAYLLYKANNK